MPAACFVTAANNDEEGSGLFGGRRERDILWRDICWVDKSHKEEKEPLAGIPSYVLTPSNPLTDVGLFRMAPDWSKARWVGAGDKPIGSLPEGCRPLLQGTPDALNTWEVDGKRKYFTDYPRIPDELNDQKVPAGEATKRSVLATWLYIRGEKQCWDAVGVDGSCDGNVRSWFQEDVIQLAYIMTGWAHKWDRKNLETGDIWFDQEMHQKGDKIVLGVKYKNDAKRELAKVIHHLATHPICIKFVSTKLCRHFITDEPTDEMINPVILGATKAKQVTNNNSFGVVRRIDNIKPRICCSSIYLYYILK